MKNTRPFAIKTRVLSFILTLLLIFYAIPATVFAEVLTVGTDETQVLTDTAENFDPEVAREIYEVEELREENAKHFRLEDGSYLAASYVDPVHYLDEDGKWQDIDNRLFSVNGEFSTSNARVKFAKKITGNENLFTLHDGNAKITMGLLGAKKQTEGKVTTDYLSDDNEETKLGKMTNLEKLMSKIVYEDVLDGVDIEYVVHSLHVKENIKVKERAESYSYSFSIKLNKLTAELLDGGVIFKDDEGTVKYKIPSPIVYDSVGQIAPEGAAYYTLSGSKNKYYLTVTVDPEWMNREDILFPVTIDPTVEDARATKSAEDITQSRNVTDPYLVIAFAQSPSYVTISSLPTISSSSLIADAKVSFRYMRSSGRVFPSVAAYNVVNESGNITQGSTIIDYEVGANPKFTYTFDITDLAREWYNDPTSSRTFALSRYVTDGEDLLVTGNGEIGVMHLYSTDSIGTYNTTPYFEISYEMMYGLEDYWTYTSQSAGIAGSGHVNIATGNLVFAIDTLTSTDSLMPVTATLVYNSALSGKDYNSQNAYTAYNTSYMPYGFKLNLCETIITQMVTLSNGTSSRYYLYTDADGTTHRFKQGVWKDESALGLEMSSATTSSTTITITDRNKIVKTFKKMSSTLGSGWYLASITDKVGNRVSIMYDSNCRPLYVELVPNRTDRYMAMLEFSYNSAGKLSQIKSLTDDRYVAFSYSSTYNGATTATSGYLRQITYHYGNSQATASYTYNSMGILIEARDNLSGGRINYTHSGYKVIDVREYGRSNELGQEVSLTYGNGYTILRSSGENDVHGDNDDICTNYSYDENGRVISYYSADAGGSKINGTVIGEYETQENVKNNIKETTAIGGSTTNYLLNSGFDDWDLSYKAPTHWYKTSNVSQIINLVSLNNCYARMFAGVGDPSQLYQYVYLPNGTYTLSINYDASRCATANASIKAISMDNSENLFSKDLAKDVTYETGNMTDNMTFSVANSAGGENFKILVDFTCTDDATYPELVVHNLVLTEGIGVAHYNFVNSGHFDSVGLDENEELVAPASNFWTLNQASIVSTSAPFKKVLKITGESAVNKESTTRIYEAHGDLLTRYDYYPSSFSSNANREYAVSAFGYTTAELSASTQFGIRVDVYYYQGEGNEDIKISHFFEFKNIVGNWQFLTEKFNLEYIPESESDIPKYRCVHYVDVSCVYSGQPSGYALFDNISVTDKTQYSYHKYKYNDDGTVKISKNDYYTEYYHYDGNQNLKLKANDRGELYTYAYNEQNQIVESVYYTYTNNVGYEEYPYWLNNPILGISKTALTITKYEYTEQGLLASETNSIAIAGTSGVYADAHGFTYCYEYSEIPAIFGALTYADDNVNRPTYYFYDETDGKLLASVQNGFGTAYFYDAFGRMTGAKPATGTERIPYHDPTYTVTENAESVTYTYNSYGELSSITTDSTTYNFTYDAFGNSSSVNIGENSLATYEYNQNNGKPNKVVYGNGYYERYVYNDLDILAEVWYNYVDSNSDDMCAVKYFYTVDGNLSRVDDLLSGISTVYVYDTAGRIVEIGEYSLDDMHYYKDQTFTYDSENRLSYTYQRLNYLTAQSVALTSLVNDYDYTDDGKISSGYVSFGTRLNMSYSYDLFDRLTKAVYSSETSSGFKNVIDYEYRTSPHNSTYLSGTVSKYTSKIGSSAVTTDTVYEYSYDERGNITHILQNGYHIYYHYDDLGQLVREDNEIIGETYEIYYDDAGNIEAKLIYPYTTADSTSGGHDTNIYHYDNSIWGDQLTMFDNDITYDAIGNPIEYYNGFTFGWSGRNLISATKGANTHTFVYNSDGIRTEKTVNGVVHTYHYTGTQLFAERWVENGIEHVMTFLYDANGVPLGFKYRNSSYAQGAWDGYWYERNLQGDIVAIYNDSNVKLVSYAYDAWGNHTPAYSNDGASIVPIASNPLRYRGYYYDIDLGLYYLQSRYYDSNTGRFINADGHISTGTGMLGYNMYAYCNNNPVMYVDSVGNSPGLILGLVALSAIVLLALTSCSDLSSAPKSITDDIHMYEDGKGSPQKGKKNVKFSPEGDNPSFQIENSYEIKSKDEQREVLEYIVNSEYYSYDTYGRTIDSMIIEWEAHNEINVIFPHDRLKSVDFDKNSEEWVKEDYWDYAIQEFLKGNW